MPAAPTIAAFSPEPPPTVDDDLSATERQLLDYLTRTCTVICSHDGRLTWALSPEHLARLLELGAALGAAQVRERVGWLLGDTAASKPARPR